MNTTRFEGPININTMQLPIESIFDQVTQVAEIIRKASILPSGTLYAQVMDRMDLRTYNNILGVLKRTGLIREKSFQIAWTGPSIQQAQTKRTFHDETFKQMQERLAE